MSEQYLVLETDSQGSRVEPSGQVFDDIVEARDYADKVYTDGRYRLYRLVEVSEANA